MKRFTLLSKVRMAFAAMIALAGIGTLSSFNTAQTPTYYKDPVSGAFESLPTDQSKWTCVAGDTYCTYDENFMPIDSRNQQIVIQP